MKITSHTLKQIQCGDYIRPPTMVLQRRLMIGFLLNMRQGSCWNLGISTRFVAEGNVVFRFTEPNNDKRTMTTPDESISQGTLPPGLHIANNTRILLCGFEHSCCCIYRLFKGEQGRQCTYKCNIAARSRDLFFVVEKQ